MRSLLALVLLLVGALLVPISTAGWWLRDTVVPADAYVETVAPLARNADVQDAVRDRLLREVDRTVGSLEDVPAPLRERIGLLLREAAQAVVVGPAFHGAWREANREAHRQIIGALAGDTASVDVRGGTTVVLRLDALADAIRDEVADAAPGFAAAVPEVRTSYPVGDVEDLGRARTAYTVLEDYGRLLPFVAAALIVLGLVLARRRGLALAGTALLTLVGLGLLWFGLGLARTSYVDALPAAVPADAGRAYFDVLTADLRTLLVYVSAGSGVALLLGAATAGIRSR